MNQKFKTIAPLKNAFQNIAEFQNCSLKKCISEHETLNNYSVLEADSNLVINSVSDSDSDSDSESDFSSVFMNLEIRIFFILYLHFSQ